MTLPTFLIIGAPKCGTTSLYTYLDQHPDVFMPAVKEPRYFVSQDPRYIDRPMKRPVVSDRSVYESMFEDGADHRARGEASTAYLRSTHAAGAVYEAIPDARLIVLLRDPVARAYSAWGHLRREGREPIGDFLEAVAAEPERVRNGEPFALMRYIETGLYHRQLSVWLELFSPDQMLIHLSEELRQRRDEVVASCYRHIGVESSFRPHVGVDFNTSGIPRSRAVHAALRGQVPESLRRVVRAVTPTGFRRRTVQRAASMNLRRLPPLDDSVYEALAPSFAADIEGLRGLLERDLEEWRTVRVIDA